MNLSTIKQFKRGLSGQVEERINGVPGLVKTDEYFDLTTGLGYRVDEVRMRVQCARPSTGSDDMPPYGPWQPVEP